MTRLASGVADLVPELTAWRRDIHAHPEMAFKEHRTAALVARRLADFDVEVHSGVAGTGVVGVLRNGEGPAIGLRADMDALPIDEQTGVAHCSTHPGTMHACGHDGHTTMLLGAAALLARNRSFAGTVVFVFQPAEENEGGGRAMVEAGLFERFPVDGVYGMHNWPGMPVGQFATRAGPLMAGSDKFELTIRGRGAHAAMPHMGADPIVAATQIVSAWQTIASRNVHPVESAVVSVTQIHAGDVWNVIPETVVVRGSARSFKPEVQQLVERRMAEIARGIGAALGVECEFDYRRGYPPTINSERETGHALRAARAVAGEGNVDAEPVPTMGAEDFAYMLHARPGNYIWVGNGPAEQGRNLHSPHYDFNDAVLPLGVSYWVTLVEQLLPATR